MSSKPSVALSPRPRCSASRSGREPAPAGSSTSEMARDPEPGYAYVVFVVTRIVTGTGGLPEIETRESLHRTTDANCSERVSHHAPQMGRHTHRAGPRQRPYRRRVAAYDDVSVGVVRRGPCDAAPPIGPRAHTAHRSTGVPARPADYRLPARCC